MVAYTLNPKWYVQRLDRITPIEDVEVKEGFMKAIDKMYDPIEANLLCIEWKKSSTLWGYLEVAKIDLETMSQDDPKLWWTMHGPRSLITTLAICLLSQVSSSSTAKRNWSTYSFIHFIKRNMLTSRREKKLVTMHSALHLIDCNTNTNKESLATQLHR